MRADWLKIVFVELDGDKELARAVDVVMARAKRIYILLVAVFSKRNRKRVLRVSIEL